MRFVVDDVISLSLVAKIVPELLVFVIQVVNSG